MIILSSCLVGSLSPWRAIINPLQTTPVTQYVDEDTHTKANMAAAKLELLLLCGAWGFRISEILSCCSVPIMSGSSPPALVSSFTEGLTILPLCWLECAVVNL